MAERPGISIPQLENKADGLMDSNNLVIDNGAQTFRLSAQQLFDYIKTKGLDGKLNLSANNCGADILANIKAMPYKWVGTVDLDTLKSPGIYGAFAPAQTNIKQPLQNTGPDNIYVMVVGNCGVGVDGGNPMQFACQQNNGCFNIYMRKYLGSAWGAWQPIGSQVWESASVVPTANSMVSFTLPNDIKKMLELNPKRVSAEVIVNVKSAAFGYSAGDEAANPMQVVYKSSQDVQYATVKALLTADTVFCPLGNFPDAGFYAQKIEEPYDRMAIPLNNCTLKIRVRY
ncbi:hypothetical protein AAIR98_001315 [Elusimicrobium simillimum]|uniref:pyocin knob domain-containing protein n=1 Tax=Elusimicrobium simillimum TaxID=3143438 RepID=UPI003C6ECA7E